MGGPIEGNIKTTKNPDETSTVEYVPEEEGPYVVNIKYDGDHIPGTIEEDNISTAARKTYLIFSGSPFEVLVYSEDGQTPSSCKLCNEIVGGAIQTVQYDNKQFCTQCFVCTNCKKSLVNQQFAPGDANTFYCVICYEEMFGIRCAKCSKSITGIDVYCFIGNLHPFNRYWFSGSYIENEDGTKQWHEDCVR